MQACWQHLRLQLVAGDNPTAVGWCGSTGAQAVVLSMVAHCLALHVVYCNPFMTGTSSADTSSSPSLTCC
jgi:hypothetical protein